MCRTGVCMCLRCEDRICFEKEHKFAWQRRERKKKNIVAGFSILFYFNHVGKSISTPTQNKNFILLCKRNGISNRLANSVALHSRICVEMGKKPNQRFVFECCSLERLSTTTKCGEFRMNFDRKYWTISHQKSAFGKKDLNLFLFQCLIHS